MRAPAISFRNFAAVQHELVLQTGAKFTVSISKVVREVTWCQTIVFLCFEVDFDGVIILDLHSSDDMKLGLALTSYGVTSWLHRLQVMWLKITVLLAFWSWPWHKFTHTAYYVSCSQIKFTIIISFYVSPKYSQAGLYVLLQANKAYSALLPSFRSGDVHRETKINIYRTCLLYTSRCV